MHPILSDRKKHLLYLAIWSAVGALTAFLVSSVHAIPLTVALLTAVPMLLIYGEINLTSWYLSRAFPLGKTPIPVVLTVAGASAMIVSGLWSALGWGMITLSADLFSLTISPMPVPQSLVIIFITGIPFFIISLAVAYLLAAFEQSTGAERDAYEARLLAQNAELKALRMQIDPHFLFNSLNSISALTASDPHMARTMTTMLADFFRKSLSYGAKESIPLREELSLLNDYLAIERIRFGERLSVSITAQPGADAAAVPPLILQPLAENAIKHGIADSLTGGTVSVTAQLKNGRLFITVENPVEEDGPRKKGAGMGVEIVRQRLQALYGSNGDLRTGSSGGTFQAVLFLPWEQHA
ncbi:MAG: histidine kinase [Bacteroidetes bacterium]|nr:histidine kinase [Bacteroidota bacterium]